MDNVSLELKTILGKEPAYRRKQIEKAWFDVAINSYGDVTTLPAELKEKLNKLPWLCLQIRAELKSKFDNTRKLLIKLYDGELIETVVMGRKNLKKDEAAFQPADRYTICISSQAGCPMRCIFCATGKGGFKRQLSAEEIIDQYRLCQRLLAKEGARIANIVVMGQGEPLLNYDNVKRALDVILKNTDLGPTKITVSTAGVVPAMERLLKDDDFPAVRWAISLHSAIEETRKKIMPSNKKGFLEFFVDWTKEYHQKWGTRTHYLGLEYIMLGGVNDDVKHLEALIKLGNRMPHVRINLIPFNISDDGGDLKRSDPKIIEFWHDELMKAGFTSTIRYSQGQDIMAACGQLKNAAST